MSEWTQIVTGPSLEDLLKSLTTHGSNKKVLEFILEGGRKFKAVAYEVSDTGTVDVGLKSQVYCVVLNIWDGLAPGFGKVRANYYIDVKVWGSWKFLKTDYP